MAKKQDQQQELLPPEVITENPPVTVLPEPRDLRQMAITADVETQKVALAEYDKRRKHFRSWLLDHLEEGTHYGYPPGCEPKLNEKGEVGVWIAKPRDGSRPHYRWYPREQWKPKPSLYKAGADFVCDLLGLIDRYDADMDGWQQLGAKPGIFVYRCRLYPKGALPSEATIVGEGRGVRRVGQKGGDENNGIKMAKKSAKVDAVINGFGLADLVTQDLEDFPPPEAEPEQPDRKPGTEATPRNERVTAKMLTEALTAWRVNHPDDAEDLSAWLKHCNHIIGSTAPLFDEKTVNKASEWKMESFVLLCRSVGIPAPGELGGAGDIPF